MNNNINNTQEYYGYKLKSNLDTSKSMYDQFYELVEDKLKWYSNLMRNRFDDVFNEESWVNDSLNQRFSLITTANISDVEKILKDAESKSDEEKQQLWERLIWHIPYFVYRDRSHYENTTEPSIPSDINKPNNNCECIRIKKCHEYIWNDDDVFKISGKLICEEPDTIYLNNESITIDNRFKLISYSTNSPVYTLDNMMKNDTNISIVKVTCTSESIISGDDMFAHNILLRYCDLSECNLKYAKSLKRLFYCCNNLMELDLSNFCLDESSEDADMEDAFTNCYKLNKIIVKNCSSSTINQLKCILYKCGLNLEQIVFIK